MLGTYKGDHCVFLFFFLNWLSSYVSLMILEDKMVQWEEKSKLNYKLWSQMNELYKSME